MHGVRERDENQRSWKYILAEVIDTEGWGILDIRNHIITDKDARGGGDKDRRDVEILKSITIDQDILKAARCGEALIPGNGQRRGLSAPVGDVANGVIAND